MYERMLNKLEKPSNEDLNTYCGSKSKLFQSLNSFLSNNYNTSQEIRFPYGSKYGWCITHRKGKKLICDVFAEADSFTVMIRLSNQQFDKVYDELQEDTKQIIDNKYPCSDGGWIHYRILNEANLKDIEVLLSVKNK